MKYKVKIKKLVFVHFYFIKWIFNANQGHSNNL